MLNAIKEYMETKKGVAVTEIETLKENSKYLVNKNYLVEFKAKGSFLPSSTNTDYKAKLTGRKISKKEYNFYKDLYNKEA